MGIVELSLEEIVAGAKKACESGECNGLLIIGGGPLYNYKIGARFRKATENQFPRVYVENRGCANLRRRLKKCGLNYYEVDLTVIEVTD